MLTREEIEQDMEKCKVQMGQIQGVFGYLQGKLDEVNKAGQNNKPKMDKVFQDEEV
jgi:hypothetical protein